MADAEWDAETWYDTEWISAAMYIFGIPVPCSVREEDLSHTRDATQRGRTSTCFLPKREPRHVIHLTRACARESRGVVYFSVSPRRVTSPTPHPPALALASGASQEVGVPRLRRYTATEAARVAHPPSPCFSPRLGSIAGSRGPASARRYSATVCRLGRFPAPIARNPPYAPLSSKTSVCRHRRNKTRHRQSRRHRTPHALCSLHDQVACWPPPAARIPGFTIKVHNVLGLSHLRHRGHLLFYHEAVDYDLLLGSTAWQNLGTAVVVAACRLPPVARRLPPLPLSHRPLHARTTPRRALLLPSIRVFTFCTGPAPHPHAPRCTRITKEPPPAACQMRCPPPASPSGVNADPIRAWATLARSCSSTDRPRAGIGFLPGCAGSQDWCAYAPSLHVAIWTVEIRFRWGVKEEGKGGRTVLAVSASRRRVARIMARRLPSPRLFLASDSGLEYNGGRSPAVLGAVLRGEAVKGEGRPYFAVQSPAALRAAIVARNLGLGVPFAFRIPCSTPCSFDVIFDVRLHSSTDTPNTHASFPGSSPQSTTFQDAASPPLQPPHAGFSAASANGARFCEHERRDGVPGLCCRSARRRMGCVAFVACAHWQEQGAARMGNGRAHRCGEDPDGVVLARRPRAREDTATGARSRSIRDGENVVPPPPHIALAGFTSSSPSQRSPRRRPRHLRCARVRLAAPPPLNATPPNSARHAACPSRLLRTVDPERTPPAVPHTQNPRTPGTVADNGARAARREISQTVPKCGIRAVLGWI
ncbi:hypothetical protein GGX14DRAFT_610486 [Mycena pura]|uniref:Uncharacterized protein n=1 Tax=Mycena pura TaxID=153505 RepID=A0AAD6XVG5_9AGAR|nr:hypothetical protein GGX14DRAFT_610486 [Mycena pura]